jgi:membrane protein implicated in regulation of membrane protease activity
VHVLSTDEIAEHVPGCNLSVRRSVLMEIGGFDPIYKCAGDDVDVCWRIQEAGYTIGFHPSALVWHHRRNSLKAYWNQQKGYGKAEALLEHKWPEKYNGFGHVSWAGRIYGNGFTLPINVKKGKVFYGTWGSALFQSVYQPANGFFNSIPLMPEWYLLTLLFAAMACLGFLWAPLLLLWPVFIASVAVISIQAVISAIENTSLTKEQEKNWKYLSLIIVLHIIQPIARLRGRIIHGLTPWRIRGAKATLKHLTFFRAKTLTHWSEGNWKANETWLEEIEQNIINLKARVKRGGDFDKWDIKTRNGLFSTAKGVLTVEEHGANKQYIKFNYWGKYSVSGLLLIGFMASIAALAAIDNSLYVAGILLLLTAVIAVKYIYDSASVVNCIVTGFQNLSVEVHKETRLEVVHNIDSKREIFEDVEEYPVEAENAFENIIRAANLKVGDPN